MDCHSVSLRWVSDGDLVTTVIYELCFRSKNYRLVDSSPVVVASFDIGITDRIFQTCLLLPIPAVLYIDKIFPYIYAYTFS